MTDPDCLICSMEETVAANRVFVDELWAAEVAPGYEVPGWFFLRSRRHADRVTGLNAHELASFGQHVQDLTLAVERATGAPAVYLLAFGENYRHFHALITARGEDVPAEQRGGAIVQRLGEHRDPAAAAALATQVRLAYEDIVLARDRAEVR